MAAYTFRDHDADIVYHSCLSGSISAGASWDTLHDTTYAGSGWSGTGASIRPGLKTHKTNAGQWTTLRRSFTIWDTSALTEQPTSAEITWGCEQIYRASPEGRRGTRREYIF